MKKVSLKKNKSALSGNLSFPGDKSLSHRAIIFGSLAEGTSFFTNVLPGEDCECTRKAFESMGVVIERPHPTSLVIHGRGLKALEAPKSDLYLGNSGTSMRLLLGVLAGHSFQAVLTGDPSLSARPMRRVTDYLKKMGADIEGKEQANFAPLTIRGGSLKGIEAKLAIPSAQVKSAILLAGLYAEGSTSVSEPIQSRDHTERFLSYFGAKINREGTKVTLDGDEKLLARSFEIAGDISSAAFFMAIAALLPDSQITFKSVLWNPTRTGIVAAFQKMGVKVKVISERQEGPENVADFVIQSSEIRPFEIQKQELPALIDEIPILTVLATQAHGRSIIHDADELRVKETDRIRSMVETLSQMGADIKAKGNSIYIEGPTPLRGACVRSFKDHRTAMSLVVAGLLADGQTEVEDLECINTSFPNFFDLLKQIGVHYNLE